MVSLVFIQIVVKSANRLTLEKFRNPYNTTFTTFIYVMKSVINYGIKICGLHTSYFANCLHKYFQISGFINLQNIHKIQL